MILFTNEMKIEIPHIDSQHKSLVDFANKATSLCAANPSKEEMKECLDFLGNYVIRHFSDEEKLQLESNYPRYRQHKEIHEEFVRTFLSMCAEFEKYGPSEELSVALTKRVSNWIITHIKVEDVRFGQHYALFKENRLETNIPGQAE